MNQIKNIEIKSFKSIRHLRVDDCKRINVFVGYPNVGKSNILEAIGLYSSLRLIGEGFKFDEICRVKRFSELFFNKDYRSATNIVLNTNVLLELVINSEANLDIRIHKLNKEDITRKTQFYSSTVNIRDYFYRDNQPINEPVLKEVMKPVRKYEFRVGEIMDQKGPLALSIPYGRNLLEVFHNDSVLRKEIAGLFEDYNQKLVIDDEDIFFLKYLSDDTAVSIPYHLISDTLRRLIFYKAAILSNKESILLFEEPEAHMFPPYMRKFTSDLIFDKTNQFFITTHSPYVLDTLMEEVPEELSIYLVYYENGECKVKRMSERDMEEVNDFGVDVFYNLENYLKNGQVNNA
jgi:AAA15 family ATPase/GTPase